MEPNLHRMKSFESTGRDERTRISLASSLSNKRQSVPMKSKPIALAEYRCTGAKHLCPESSYSPLKSEKYATYLCLLKVVKLFGSNNSGWRAH